MHTRTHTHTEADRHMCRDRYTDTQTQTHTKTQTDRHMCRDRYTHTQTDKQTNRHTHTNKHLFYYMLHFVCVS